MERHISFLVGNGLIVLSGPLIGINGFKGNTFAVTAGFLLLVLGYKILQESFSELINYLEEVSVYSIIFDLFLVSIGMFLVSKGFVTGAIATQNPNIVDMMSSGIFAVLGHSIAHLGVNKTFL